MNVESSVLILLIIVSLVFGQNNEKNITNNEIPITSQNVTSPPPPSPPASTSSPLETICNQIETCQQYDKITTSKPDHKDLRTRKCMCDQECPTYGDCCKDSKYYNTSSQKKYSFSCENAPFDGYVYVVNKCAPDYTNSSTIIENCHTTDRLSLVRNFLLTLLVSTNKIIYKNAYCAICNYELNFNFWQPIFQYDIETPDFDIILQNTTVPLSSNKTNYQTVTGSMVFGNITIDEKRAELTSEINGISYSCKILPNAVANVLPSIRYCLPESNNPLCSDCVKPTPTNTCIPSTPPRKKIAFLDVNLPSMPRFNSCIDIPANISNENVFCPGSKVQNNTTPSNTPDNIEGCFFMNAEGRPCLISTFFAPGYYEYLENGSLYVPLLNFAFPPEEYTNETSVANAVYVCGTEVPMPEKEKKLDDIRKVLSEVLIKFSIFFLIVYLVTNVNKQKLQSLPNKILYSFCITLLVLYLDLDIADRLKSCRIPAGLLHYLLLSCFAWLLIASYDFWQVICRSSTKLQTLAGKTRLKRYLIYCFFGWISPLFIIAVSLFFELSPNNVVSCPYKPGYGRLNTCFISQYYPKQYLFLYPTTVIFCLIIVLFAHTSYHIYLSKRKNIKSTAQNNYYMLFMKLALTMGLTWTIGLFVTYTDLNIFKFLYVILNSSHGTLMYFAYGFKCTTLTKMYEKHKNNTIVQQTKSTFFSITDKIKSPTSQATSSLDPPTQEMESTN